MTNCEKLVNQIFVSKVLNCRVICAISLMYKVLLFSINKIDLFSNSLIPVIE